MDWQRQAVFEVGALIDAVQIRTAGVLFTLYSHSFVSSTSCRPDHHITSTRWCC